MLAALCITGQPPFPLANGYFSLQWQHSVEHVLWREDWQVEDDRLVLISAAVKGSGAGMEAGEGAVLEDGWWRWQFAPPRELRVLILASSGATGAGWQICDADIPTSCREIGTRAGIALTLSPCHADLLAE